MGALPPMDESQWQQAFDKYKHIAQYQYLNSNFTLSNFKFIFFWEWFHRLWARLIGVSFLIPFIYFLYKSYFKQWMITPLVILFLLGGLQGAIGWLMVKSGLNDTDVYVSHIRLAVHFMAAMALICYALVFGLMLSVPKQDVASSPIRNGAIAITVLLCIQLIYGAFMAGLKAAPSAPTFPDINGTFLPPLDDGGLIHNILYNKLAVHFIHRMLAYIVSLAIIVWWICAGKLISSPVFNRVKHWPLLLVIIQVCLGALAVVNSPYMTRATFGVFEWLAIAHQLTGMLLLLTMVAMIYLNSGKSLAARPY